MQFVKHVKTRYEKFGAVVFDTLREKVYITNDSGKEILSLMDEGLDASAIADRLAQEHEKDAAEIQNDVTEFIDGLQSAELMASLEEK